jgi:hypothetical protein
MKINFYGDGPKQTDAAAEGKRLTRRHEELLELYAAAASGDCCRMCET